MTGALTEARPYLERALAIREKVLGEEHPATATSLHNLAFLLHNQGSYEEARRHYEKALAITEKVLGEKHPDTAASLNNLATLLMAQGSYQEARPLLERALAITEKALGEEHPVTKRVRQNLTTLGTHQRETSIGFFRRLIVNAFVNAFVGLILLLLTNLFLSDDVPVNLLTLVICAIVGVVGWLLIVILHLLGIAF